MFFSKRLKTKSFALAFFVLKLCVMFLEFESIKMTIYFYFFGRFGGNVIVFFYQRVCKRDIRFMLEVDMAVPECSAVT